jgi:23S rRNA (uracil1939-C5)-methyltransferase
VSAQLELTIDSLAAGGDGVGRDDGGRVVFVPHTAPGDRVVVELITSKKSFARARLVDLIEPGPDRVEPRCPLFADGSCGGCQWQHVSATTQAEAKQAIVASALRKLIAGGLELAPIETPVPPYEWRRRARLHWVRPRRAGAALLGLHPPRSRRITEVDRCPQLEPAANAALAAVRERLLPGLTGRGELELIAGHSGDVHLAVRGPCEPEAARALADDDRVAGVILGRRCFGSETIEVEPGIRGRANEFAQASRAGNSRLRHLVAEVSAPRNGARILELFAGAGNLTAVLADGAESVVAVDRQRRPAILQDHVEYRQGSAREELAILARREPGFDLVVLDPPRTGAADLVPTLARMAVPRLVYVSCDPATMARDAAMLVDAGYRPVRVVPIDLMPQTAHVEAVMTLARAAPQSAK